MFERRSALLGFISRLVDLGLTALPLGDDPDEIKNWVWPSGEPVAS